MGSGSALEVCEASRTIADAVDLSTLQPKPRGYKTLGSTWQAQSGGHPWPPWFGHPCGGHDILAMCCQDMLASLSGSTLEPLDDLDR